MIRHPVAVALASFLSACGTQAPSTCRLNVALTTRSVEVVETRHFEGSTSSCRALFLEQTGDARLTLTRTWNEAHIRVASIVLGHPLAMEGDGAVVHLPFDPPPALIRIVQTGLPNLDGSEWPRVIALEITLHPKN